MLLCTAALLPFLLFSIAFVYDPSLSSAIFQSDALYPSALFQDMIGDGSLSGWSLPPAPYFIPDLPIVSLFQWMGGVRFAMFAAAITIFLLLYLSFRMLLQELERGRQIASITVLNDLFLLLFFYILLFDRSVFVHLILPGHHAGNLILTNVSLLLLLRIVHRGAESLLIWLAALIFISNLSDSLFTLTFVIPSLAITPLIWNRMEQRRGILVIMTILTGYALSVYALRIFRDQGVVFIPDLNAMKHLKTGLVQGGFFEDMFHAGALFFEQNPAAYLWPFIMAGCLSLFVYVTKRNGTHHDVAMLSFFYLTAAALNFAGNLFTGLHFNNGLFSLRYLLFIPLFPILFLTYGVAHILPLRVSASLRLKRTGVLAFAALMVILSGAVLIRVYAAHIEEDAISCLDSYSERYSLKRGLSDYWNAKRITLLSRKGLILNQVDRELKPYHWISNIEWFISDDLEPVTFIITDRLDTALILSRFGAPAASFQCAGTTTFVYNRPGDRVFREFWNERRLRGEFLPPSAIRWNEMRK
jgi:hypothetical protein